MKEQTSKRANAQTRKRGDVRGKGLHCVRTMAAGAGEHVLCQDGWFVEHHELFGCVFSGDTNQRLLPARMFAEELQPIMFITVIFSISQREDQWSGKSEYDFFK